MKTVKYFCFVLAVSILICMTLTCAYAAVNESVDQDFRHAQGMGKLVAEKPLTGVKACFGSDPVPGKTFKLPAMLQIIEDEAFEGTAALVIELADEVESIGDRAFAGNPFLRVIRIPEKTHYIGKDVFTGSGQVMITGMPGSYGRKWAKEHQIPFSPITVICASLQDISTSFQVCRQELQTIDDSTRDECTQSPRWIIERITISHYNIRFTHHVQGRSPPAYSS